MEFLKLHDTIQFAYTIQIRIHVSDLVQNTILITYFVQIHILIHIFRGVFVYNTILITYFVQIYI